MPRTRRCYPQHVRTRCGALGSEFRPLNTGTAAARHDGVKQLPSHIEQAMLEVLNRPAPATAQREKLRALFVELAPAHAHGLIRRVDAGGDPLAVALRRFMLWRR